LVGYRPQSWQKVGIGADAAGNFIGISHEAITNTSRYEDFREGIVDASKFLYACENVDTKYNLLPLDLSTPVWMRGPGEATGCFALESAIDELSYKLKMDPIELRLKNYTTINPENKFPSALKDANLALEWLAQENDLSISTVSLCGDSAGAHLAASLSTYRAIHGLELPHSQCLLYPMTDPACNSKSQIDFQSGYFLTQQAMIWFWNQMIASNDNLNEPTFNLTLDPKVPLPKTLIITAGFDPLSDEGEAYARLLHNAGNEVQQIHYPHLIHGFVNMTSLKAAEGAAKDLISEYKNLLS
jgi:hypothetical protein